MKIVWPSCQIIHIKGHAKLHTQTHTTVPCNVMPRACKKTSKKIHSFKHNKCTKSPLCSSESWYKSMLIMFPNVIQTSWFWQSCSCSNCHGQPDSCDRNLLFFLKVIHTKLHRWNHQNPKRVKLLHKNQIPENSYLIPFATTKSYSNFWN
jgi:hypothetical protein